MVKAKLRLTVALLVGVASELMPVPGLLGAALVFPQGILGNHGISYLVLALCLNFALSFAVCYYVFGLYYKIQGSKLRR